MPLKVIVTGSSGMLAGDLVSLLKKDFDVHALSRKELDITDTKAIEAALSGIKPDFVVNCAAYTRVDMAESEPDRAYLINSASAGRLASACAKFESRLIHISTDFVFDGAKNSPYMEVDPVNPLSVYGKSKLEGEREIARICRDFIIIRTSWLYGAGNDNFPKKIISLAREKDSLAVVYDRIGTPTYTVDLSAAVVNLLEAPAGIYHFSNEGVASWYDFAYMAVEMIKKRGTSLKLKELKPILSGEYPTPAKRPAYSVMDKAKYKKTTGKTIPHWADALERYVEKEWPLR